MINNVVLMGNPNVGKTALFSEMTGTEAQASNYPGTTVDILEGRIEHGNDVFNISDVPGTYSLEAGNDAERIASEMLEDADVVVNVVDASNLERNLGLTYEIAEKDVPMVVVLNMWDEVDEGEISPEALSEELGVPVVTTVARDGRGVEEVVSVIGSASVPSLGDDGRWDWAEKVAGRVSSVGEKGFKGRLSDFTVRPVTGIPFALAVMALSFFAVRFIGEGLIGNVFDPFFQVVYRPAVTWLHGVVGDGFLGSVLVGELVDGEIRFMESMGALTTGVYVPFAAVLPYIIAFYSVLSVLEDSGYLPRLSALADGIFRKLGMGGQGVVPLFLGMGCNVPGTLATRNLDSYKHRFIAITLLAVSVPCMAQTAMIFGILGSYGIRYVFLVFIVLALTYVFTGVFLRLAVDADSEGMVLELPKLRLPDFGSVFKKTFIRSKWFLREAVPYLVLGIVLVNVLYVLGVMDAFGSLFSPLVVNIFGLPSAAVPALVIGFLRKDLAVGMLMGLGMSPEQLVIAATILTIYFPCAATFATMFKELGFKDILKSVSVMFLVVFLVGSILRVVLL